MQQRPWREQIFQRIVAELRTIKATPSLRVLELGFGPGLLAQSILESFTDVRSTMLDFSPAMHALARERLGPRMERVRPVVADFKRNGWSEGLGTFEAIVTNQAVHELRHKRHTLSLHRTVRE